MQDKNTNEQFSENINTPAPPHQQPGPFYPGAQPVYYPVYTRPKIPGKGLGITSLVLGIITLGSLLLLRLSVPFLLGGVGIILAILSKGGARKMIGKATAGLICCITALALDIAFCVFAVWLVFSLPKLSPSLTEEVNKICEEQYGVSYDEMMEEIYDMWDMEN